jgi:hypothetical protein
VKLSECTIGKAVQYSHLSYDEAIKDGSGFGHIKRFHYTDRGIKVGFVCPNGKLLFAYHDELKPLED